MIKNWLKIYGTNLQKNKVYFILTVLGLAIGIWGVLLAYLYYNEEIRYDQWNPHKDEVFIISADLGEGDIWMLAPFPVGPHLKEEKQVIDDYMYLSNYISSSLVFEGEKILFSKGLKVQANFFSFFPFELVQGEAVLDEPNSVLVLDTYAEELFGKEALGKTFTFEEEEYLIKGLYTFGDTRNSIAPHMLFSGMERVVAKEQQNWGNYNATLYIKLRDQTQTTAVAAAISNLMYEHVYVRLAKEQGKTVQEYLDEEGETMEIHRLFPLSGQHMITDINYNGTLEPAINSQRLYILIGLSLTILILSVVNYMNLSIVQSLKRHREFGVRLVVGSSYTAIFWQLFFESCLTLLFATGLSFVFVEFSLPSLRVFLHSQLYFNLIQELVFGVTFIIGLAFFLAVVLLLVLRKVSKTGLLKGEFLKNNQRFSVRHTMLIIQFAIASFFMMGTMVVYQQVNYMLDKDLGFTKQEILILPFLSSKQKKERQQLYDIYKTELLQIKGVEAVGSSTLAIGGGGYNSSSISHQGVSVQVMNVGIDEDFLTMMEIKVVEGRSFQQEIASDTISNILINQHLKDKFGDSAILGKQINWNGSVFTVIGIVDNYHTGSFKSDYAPMIFFNLKIFDWQILNVNELYVKIDPTKTEEIIAQSEQVYKALDIAAYPFSHEFVDRRFAHIFKSSMQERNILLVLSVIVVFIALFGLYSMASFTIANQYKEIAIRKVLGASNNEQMRQLSQRYLLLAIIGFGLSIYPSYYFMNAWLNDYVFRIDIQWVNFVFAFLFLMVLTFITVYIKVRQAVQVNVLKYIKYE